MKFDNHAHAKESRTTSQAFQRINKGNERMTGHSKGFPVKFEQLPYISDW